MENTRYLRQFNNNLFLSKYEHLVHNIHSYLKNV
jgi:hypothetical protein